MPATTAELTSPYGSSGMGSRVLNGIRTSTYRLPAHWNDWATQLTGLLLCADWIATAMGAPSCHWRYLRRGRSDYEATQKGTSQSRQEG